jgi:hypothetical protein
MTATLPREPYGALIKAMANELGMVAALTGLDEQFHRRLMVRVVFSAFEAFAFNLKRRSLATGQPEGVTFSKTQLEKLTELRTNVRADGSTEARNFFLKSQDNLDFALKIYSQVLKAPPAPPVPAAEMAIGVEARDRLTHPKTAAAFFITDEEDRAVGSLVDWFKQAVEWFADAEVAYIARMREEVAALHKQLQARRPKA